MYFITREIAKIQIPDSTTPRQKEISRYPRIVKIVRTVPIETSPIRRPKMPSATRSALKLKSMAGDSTTRRAGARRASAERLNLGPGSARSCGASRTQERHRLMAQSNEKITIAVEGGK